MGDLGEGEGVCDFEDAVLLHTDNAARGEGRERLAARGSNLDSDLKAIVSLLYVSSNTDKIVERPQIAGCGGVTVGKGRTYQSVDLHRLERDIFRYFRHVCRRRGKARLETRWGAGVGLSVVVERRIQSSVTLPRFPLSEQSR